MNVNIRILKEYDAYSYQQLRLQSLKEHPTFFAASYENESDFPVEKVNERLKYESLDKFSLGAFRDDELLGFVTFFRNSRPKTRHRGQLAGMYVKPELRGQRIGKALLDECLQRIRKLADLEEVVLAITVGNEAARQLYQSVGFSPYCVEPRYIKFDDQYYDMEWLSLPLS